MSVAGLLTFMLTKNYWQWYSLRGTAVICWIGDISGNCFINKRLFFLITELQKGALGFSLIPSPLTVQSMSCPPHPHQLGPALD